MDRDDAADIATTRVGRLGSGNHFGLRDDALVCGALGERRGVDLVTQRRHLAASLLGAGHELVDGWQGPTRRARCHGNNRRRGWSAGEIAAQGRLRASAIGCRGRPIDVELQHLAFGTKTIEASRVPGRFALRKHRSKLLQAVADGRQLTFAVLGSHEIRKRQPQIGSQPAHLIARTARRRVNQGGCRADLERTTAGYRQHLPDHRQMLGDAGNRLAVIGDARIRPAAGGQHVGAGDVDGRIDRADARIVGRQLCQRLRFGQRQRLRADARGQ